MNPLLLPRLAATALVGCLGLTLVGAIHDRLPRAAPQAAEIPPELAAVPEPLQPLQEGQVLHRVRRGETLSEILARYGVAGAGAIRRAALKHTDLAKIRAGSALALHYERGVDRAVGLSLAVDESHELWVDLAGEPAARLLAIPYEVRPGHREIAIEGTLWKAALGAGLRARDILRLATIFEYDVDFNTELRAGDTFTLVMDELWLDGAYVRPGTIHAVRMVNRGRAITAIRFEDPASGEVGWYDEEGTTRRKPFLRSPLAFSQVTSGYDLRRMDPIAHQVIAHVGTDFGAPTGTAVRAVGDGVVAHAGWNGGYGLYVKLDHAGPYDTAYAHLSKVLVAPGQRVKQGDLIGRVGTTGYSTGPHLHYEVHVGGVPKDPMRVELPAAGAELSAETMPAFAAVRDRWLPQLDDPASLADLE